MKKAGWFRESRRHREAYYKNKQRAYKDQSPTPSPNPERRIRIVNGEVVRAGQAPITPPTPPAPTRPLPPIKLFRLDEFIQRGDTGDIGARKLATAEKIMEVYRTSATSEEINIPSSASAIVGANERYYIATKGNGTDIVGAVAITMSSGAIHHLVVSEKKGGYGKALYYKLESIVRDEVHPQSFYCLVRESNEAGKRFWSSVGFSHEGWGSDRSYRYVKTFRPAAETTGTRRPFRIDEV